MNYKELEQEIKRLEEQIEDQINILRSKFLESEANKKLYEVKVPEDIGDYYYVSESGDIDLVEDVFHDIDYEGLYQRGLAFKTRAEAEQFDKERILIKKLKDWAKEHQRDWTPDWNDLDEEKNSVIYDNGHKKLKTIKNYRSQEIIKLPYFKSEEIAREFIEVFGEEIKEVLY